MCIEITTINIYSGEYAMEVLLIKNGIDVNSKSNEGDTALISTARNGNFQSRTSKIDEN